MAYKISVEPTEEPLSKEEAKTHLRERSTDYDSEIQNLIVEGRKYVERMTGRALISQTWKYYMDELPTEFKLPLPPLSSVTSISYQDTSNATQTLGSGNYTVDTFQEPGRVFKSFTGTYPDTYSDLNAVTVTFVCGYGNKEDVPESLKRAIKLYVQWQFDHDPTAKDLLDAIIQQERVEWLEHDV